MSGAGRWGRETEVAQQGIAMFRNFFRANSMARQSLPPSDSSTSGSPALINAVVNGDLAEVRTPAEVMRDWENPPPSNHMEGAEE